MNKYETPVIEKHEFEAVDVILESATDTADFLITRGAQIGNLDSNKFNMFK